MNLLISRVPVLLPGGRRLGEPRENFGVGWCWCGAQAQCGEDEGGALLPWGLFSVPWDLLWSLVCLSHLLDCSLLSVSSLTVSLISGAELSLPIFMPPTPQFLSHPHFWCVLPYPGPSELAGRVGVLHAPQTPALGSVWGRSHRREAGLGPDWDGQHHAPVPAGTLCLQLPGATLGLQGTSVPSWVSLAAA